MARRAITGGACLTVAALAGVAWSQLDPATGESKFPYPHDAAAPGDPAGLPAGPGAGMGRADPAGGMSAIGTGGTDVYAEMMGMGGGALGGDEEYQRVAQTNSLVHQWKNAAPEARKELEGELTAVLTETFVARQATHEREVAALERKVRRLREQLDRRKARQAEIVDFRLRQLLREAEGLGWGAEPDANAGMGIPGMMSGTGGMPGGEGMTGGGFGGFDEMEGGAGEASDPAAQTGEGAGEAPLPASEAGDSEPPADGGAAASDRYRDPADLTGFRGSPVGERIQFSVLGRADAGPVWGTDIYTDDSSLAAAAVHAGVLKDGERGHVVVTIKEGRSAYAGSTRDGVTSGNWGEHPASYSVEPPWDGGQAAPSSLELFVAEDAPGEGLTEAVVEGTGAKIHLRGPAVVDGSQIPLADRGDDGVLVLHFTPAAAKAMAAATKEHLGKSLALRLDGAVVAVLKVHEVVSERAAVPGLTEAQVRRIVRVIRDSAARRRDADPAAAPPGAEGGLNSVDPVGGPPPASDPAATDRPVSGLGERFSRYRPTGELRQLFVVLGTSGGRWGVPPGEIGEITLLQSLAGKDGPSEQVFQNAGITPGHIQLLFHESLEDRSIGDMYAFLDAAEAKAKEDGLDAIDSGHLLEVLTEKGKDGPVREMLARLGLSPEEVRDRVKEVRRQMSPGERNPLQEPRRPAEGAAEGSRAAGSSE